MNKKRLSAISIVIITIVVIIVIYVLSIVVMNLTSNKVEEKQIENTLVTLQDGSKENMLNGIKKTMDNGSYQISDVSLNVKETKTTFKAIIKNITDKELKQQVIYINLIDENNNKLGVMQGFVSTLDANETERLNIVSSKNYEKAYRYEIVK